MGCGPSRDPATFLVRHSVDVPQEAIVPEAIAEHGYLELHETTVKDSGLKTALAGVEPPPSMPTVRRYATPDGVVLLQVVIDTFGYPSRDPIVTFFDASGTPVAMLTGSTINFKQAGDGRCVLYTRVAHDSSRYGFVTDSGSSCPKVEGSKTVENSDGSFQVLHAAGLIRRRFTGDASPYGFQDAGVMGLPRYAHLV